MARCLATGEQRLMCGGGGAASILAMYGYKTSVEQHDCGQDVWTGERPGHEECRRYALWCLVPHEAPITPCPAGTPDAQPDTNRLGYVCDWDPDAKMWKLRDDAEEQDEKYLVARIPVEGVELVRVLAACRLVRPADEPRQTG